MMTVTSLAIPDVKLLHPKLHHDDRGYVTEIAHDKQMADLGLNFRLVQENQSMSLRKGTVRGLHCQRPPYAQAKLVRVLRGHIWDVAVDVRPNSPTFGKFVSQELSQDVVVQMLIPAGFLHGFCTLEDNCVVLYKMSSVYVPGGEAGVNWLDHDLNIPWPVKPEAAIMSDKDKKLGALRDFPQLDW